MMDLFLSTILSFPTVIFTVLLGICLLYWLVAIIGLVDIDGFQIHLAPDGQDVGFEAGGLAGVLLKFGLDGVPFTLILSVATLLAWTFCYLADYFLLRHLPLDALRYAFGAGAALMAVVVALPFTGLALRPFRGLFVKLKQVDTVSLLGEVAVVRSPLVTLHQGTAELNNGGAGLILQVRAEPGLFARGDRVVLVEYMEMPNAYRVIAEATSSMPR